MSLARRPTRPKLTGHATVLLVSDVRRAADYYRDALGFELELYDRIPKHYGYARRDGCHIHLVCFPGVGARRTARSSPRTCSTPSSGSAMSRRCTPNSSSAARRSSTAPIDQGYGLRELRVRDRDGHVLASGEWV